MDPIKPDDEGEPHEQPVKKTRGGKTLFEDIYGGKGNLSEVEEEQKELGESENKATDKPTIDEHYELWRKRLNSTNELAKKRRVETQLKEMVNIEVQQEKELDRIMKDTDFENLNPHYKQFEDKFQARNHKV